VEAISREVFNRWVQKNNWMQIGEAITPNGRQYTFLTPSGAMVVAIYDLKGNLLAIGQPAPAPQSPATAPFLKK
jgi:hypothetical protein